MSVENNIDEIKEGVAGITVEEKVPQVIVTYCDTCRFPVEYCEYSHAVLFKKEIKAEERKEQQQAAEGEKKEDAKPVEEKKEKKKKEAIIEIEIKRTKGNKHATYVSNLDKFGLNLKDTAKLFSKKFACSSSVAKEDNGLEYVQLTGEFGYDLIDFLCEKNPNIKPEMCKVKENKKK